MTWTEQDTPTITEHPNGSTSESITNVRTNTRHYDDASRETLNETFAIDGDGPVSALTLTARMSSYDADGRLTEQSTFKSGIQQFRIVYGNATFVPQQDVPASSVAVTNYIRHFASSGGGGGFRRTVRTLAGRVILLWTTRNAGLPAGYVRIPAHWTGTGFDKAGNLHGYTVEVHHPDNGKRLYKTEHELIYRMGESYQLIKETADSFKLRDGVVVPQHGETTRTYNVNGELVQYSDIKDANNNRFFINNAQGQAMLAVQGNFDGNQGRATLNQAIDQSVTRTGTTGKAQYFFSANGQSIGSFGQLLNEASEFEANFDINYEPISSQFPASTPGQVVAQAGDTLRGIAARVLGDASLWYVIAEENGLTDPDAALEEGTLLRIPNQVLSLSNTAYSFKPFDVSDAIGDTSPTQPAPKQKKKPGGLRRFFTTLLIIIVAVVVTIYAGPYVGKAVAAGLGSAASQGAAIALGVQDEFSWEGVGAAVATAGILQGTGLGTAIAGADASIGQLLVQGAVNNAVSQGVNIALGLQDSFSWTGVAIGALSTAAASEAGDWARGQVTGSEAVQKLVGNIAAGAGSVLVRMALGGKVDTVSVLADVFGNALGNSIVDRMAPQPVGQSQARGDAPDGRRQNGGSGAEGANAQLDNNPTGSILFESDAASNDVSAVPDAAWSATAPGGIEEVIVEAQRLSEPQEDYYDRLIAPWSILNPRGGKSEHQAMAIVDLARRYDVRYENSAMIQNDRSLIGLGLTTVGGAAAAAVGTIAFPAILANTGSVLHAGISSGLLGTVAFQGYENVLSGVSGGTYGRLGLSTDEMLLGIALGPLATPRSAATELGLRSSIAAPHATTAVSGRVGISSAATDAEAGGATLVGVPATRSTNPLAPVSEFDVYGNEIMYRTMSPQDAQIFLRTGRVPATGETSLSPAQVYSEGYDGVTFRITVKPGTSALLEETAIAANSATTREFPNLVERPGKWTDDFARFKVESGQTTTQVGRGRALNIFNDNVVRYEVVRPNNIVKPVVVDPGLLLYRD